MHGQQNIGNPFEVNTIIQPNNVTATSDNSGI
jgi:hypothetical protein